METLEHLHKQIDGLDDLRSIVKTMKALSAASIRQYEQAVAALDGYARTVERGLHVVLRGTVTAARPVRAAGGRSPLGGVRFRSRAVRTLQRGGGRHTPATALDRRAGGRR